MGPTKTPAPATLLEQVEHRPWPLPAGPWLMRQSWYDVLFAHWPVATEPLRSLVPQQLALDTFEGQAWLGVVPFVVRDARARALPGVPGATDFRELNVRTYVTVEDRPGVYFFSLDASSALAVLGARTFFRLRYFEAEMHVETAGEGRTRYRSRRLNVPDADFAATYAPAGEVARALPGTLDHFLIERYCLYAAGRSGRALRAHIHHPPWPLQPADAAFDRLGVVGAAGVALPERPPLLHYAAEQHVLVWAPEDAG